MRLSSKPVERTLEFEREFARTIDGLCRAALRETRWSVDRAALVRALERSVERRFRGTASESASGGWRPPPADGEVETYLESLHAADLALAAALAAGDEPAWEFFVAEYRPRLRAAGRAMAGEQGEELADSLFAELYGIREGERRSLLDYYDGRSRLGTWLRAVLAQRHVDAVRRARRTVSLDTEPLSGSPPAWEPDAERAAAGSGRPAHTDDEPDRRRYLALVEAAVERAVAALAPGERLRLRLYYVEGLTLAEIARLDGESEATASRKLERIRRRLREQVDDELRRVRGLSEQQVALGYETVLSDPAGAGLDLERALAAGPEAAPAPARNPPRRVP